MAKTKSIITEDNKWCFFCGRVASGEHHLIFGNGRRELCEKDGIKLPICDNCHTLGRFAIHDDPVAEKLSKMLGQTLWELQCVSTDNEQRVARSEFIRRYGRSWM